MRAIASPLMVSVSFAGLLACSGCSDRKAHDNTTRSGAPVVLPPNSVPRPISMLRNGALKGPLRVHPSNSRYFTDGRGRAILLTGSHTWANLQDHGDSDPPPPFDYFSYLDFLVRHNHNFFRLWMQEQACWTNVIDRPVFWTPLPFKRTGPGQALDGKPKFDLGTFDEVYFERLRSRVAKAQDRGIYVAIMLFNGWSVARVKGGYHLNNPWRGHPFHRANNINGINGDPGGDESGEETHELLIPAVTAIQENYVRKVIDTVNDLDNVFYEISNESHSKSTRWQYHMIEYIKGYEAKKPKQHPVGMSVEYPDGDNGRLLASPADWIAPKPYEDDPLTSKGKVVIDDTDHWFGIGGDRVWAWKRFMRGGNPVFMDAYDGYTYKGTPGTGGEGFQTTKPQWTSLRLTLGYIQTYANRVDLANMVPRGELVSTGYCLASSKPGTPQFLVYQPQAGEVTVDLSRTLGSFAVQWFDPATGLFLTEPSCEGGDKRRFPSPFEGNAVLFLDQSSR